MANKRLRSYYPESSIEKGLFTNGGELMTDDLQEYKGYYHKYTNGEIFSLYEYNEKLSISLIPYDPLIINQRQTNDYYNREDIFDPKRYNTPLAKINTPTLEDFKNTGMWYRYFVRKVNDINWGIKEIDLDQFEGIQTMNTNDIDSYLFKTVKIPWKLTGELYDKNTNNILIGGVFNTNSRTINKYNENFQGLSSYLTNPLEYTIYSKWYETFIQKIIN